VNSAVILHDDVVAPKRRSQALLDIGEEHFSSHDSDDRREAARRLIENCSALAKTLRRIHGVRRKSSTLCRVVLAQGGARHFATGPQSGDEDSRIARFAVSLRGTIHTLGRLPFSLRSPSS
jgi:hypothetical protein